MANNTYTALAKNKRSLTSARGPILCDFGRCTQVADALNKTWRRLSIVYIYGVLSVFNDCYLCISFSIWKFRSILSTWSMTKTVSMINSLFTHTTLFQWPVWTFVFLSKVILIDRFCRKFHLLGRTRRLWEFLPLNLLRQNFWPCEQHFLGRSRTSHLAYSLWRLVQLSTLDFSSEKNSQAGCTDDTLTEVDMSRRLSSSRC